VVPAHDGPPPLLHRDGLQRLISPWFTTSSPDATLPEGGERLPHMLGLRGYVEDESDRSVELPGDDNVEIVRELDDGRSGFLSPVAKNETMSKIKAS
jgi:hypothetical protein